MADIKSDPTATTSQTSDKIDSLQTTQPVDKSQSQANPQYVTKDDLAQAIEAGVRRAQQSARDRAQTIETSVKNIEQRLTSLNVPITPELSKTIREQATTELDNELAEAGDESDSSVNEPTQGNPVFDWTMALYQDEGLEISKDDPEFKAIKAALDDPNGSFIKYQKIVLKSVDQKRERLSSEKESADARVMGGGETSKALGADVNPHDLFTRAHQS